MKTLIATLLIAGFVLSFASNFAHASGWDKDPYYVNQNTKVNTSKILDFDKRQTHVKGWHNSPVCGLELCNNVTGTETMKYQGLSVGGARPNIDTHHNGHYHIKGLFGNYTG